MAATERPPQEVIANERSPRALRIADAITRELFSDPEGKRGDRLMLFDR
jgi:hypothetical protein